MEMRFEITYITTAREEKKTRLSAKSFAEAADKAERIPQNALTTEISRI